MNRIVCFGLSCGMMLVSGLLIAGDAPRKIDFNRDIRPILSDKCFFCHGPDANTREAKLRLDVREAALKMGVFVPGKQYRFQGRRRLTDVEGKLVKGLLA